MQTSTLHGKWYWMLRGFLGGLIVAWLIEINTHIGIGPIGRYVAPFVIIALIILPIYEMWRLAKVNAAKKSN